VDRFFVNMQKHMDKGKLEALSRGDLQAFDSLFREYFPKMKKFLLGFLKNEAEAEDLSQDVFLKIWQSRSGLADVENLNAYLYSAAKNTLYNYIERTQKATFYSIVNTMEIPTTDQLEEMLMAEDLEKLINYTVDQMPPQRKTIFNLSRNSHFSNEEIAIQLNISKRTVEGHISAALADLRKILHLFLFFF